jgi:hypothetical protein
LVRDRRDALTPPRRFDEVEVRFAAVALRAGLRAAGLRPRGFVAPLSDPAIGAASDLIIPAASCFTVAQALPVAAFADRPFFFAPSSMCSAWRFILLV